MAAVRKTWIGWSVLGVVVVAAVLSLDPAIVGLSTRTPIAHLIAMRGWLGLGSLLAAAGCLLCALMVRKRGESRPVRLSIAFIALLVVGATHLSVLANRGLTTEEALPDDKQSADVDVLAFNTFDTADGEQVIAELIAQHAPDVVMLSEIREGAAGRIAGDDYQVFVGSGQPGGSAPTALLVAHSFGEYERIDGPDSLYGLVGAHPVSADAATENAAADGDSNLPILYAVHAASPAAERMPVWRAELDMLMDICESTSGIIMGGDFNATVDHAPLRDTACLNGTIGAGGFGTWPSGLPGLLGTPIDHIFTDPQTWQPVASAVTDLPGSDHRAILVRFRPA